MTHGRISWKSTTLVSLLAVVAGWTCGVEVVVAQVQTHQTYAKELDKVSRIQSLGGTGQFGERIDFSSGAVSFKKTVIEIPGNNKLRVAIDYALNQKTGMGNEPLYYWSRELPYLEGVHGVQHGWVVGPVGNYSNQRCSHPGAAQGAPALRSTKPPVHNFLREEYWNGNSLVVPGGAGGVIRPIGADEPRPSGLDVRWATNSDWRFTCYQLPDGSEGFVGHSPDGIKHYFGTPVAQDEVFHIANSFAPYNDTWLEVVSYRMPLTRTEDRFGNWVNYESGRVVSSDGRLITIERSGSTTTFKANGRTWTVNGGVVTNPDGTTWTLQRTGIFGWAGDQQAFHDTCRPAQNIPLSISGAVTVTIKTESGAQGVFKIEPRRHGYSHVPYRCYMSGPVPGKEGPFNYPNDAQYIDNASLVSRAVSGPGVASYQESINYGSVNACYSPGQTGAPDACTPSSPITRTVTITRSDGLVKKLTYGNRWADNAGLLLREELGSQRQTSYSYVFLNERVLSGYGKRKVFYNVNEYKVVRPNVVQITQQGRTFTHAVNAFDSMARPTRITRSSNLTGNPSVTEVISYHDNLQKWTLGQKSKVVCVAPTVGLPTGCGASGIVVSEIAYDTAARPTQFKSFGKIVETLAYNADGTLATVRDGNNNTTTLSSWKRGVPQQIKHPITPEAPSGAIQAAVVDNNGWITRVTDENGFATNYQYDSMGRLSRIDYPVSDSVTWNATSFSLARATGSAYGIPAGHWQHTEATGNARKVTYLDAMWRPVLAREYDTVNATGTQRFVRQSFDPDGRATFRSYPSTSGTPSTGVWNEYDAVGRPTSVSQDSEHGLLVTQFGYLSDFRTRVTSPNGAQVITGYLAWDQPSEEYPISVTHPAGAYTDIARDIFGKTRAITRRNRNNTVSLTRSFVYDSNQQLCKAVEPESRSTILVYDPAGNISWSASGQNYPSTSSCDTSNVPTAQKVTRVYDARNRLQALTFPDGRGSQTWTYTPDSLPATITTQNLPGAGVVANAYSYNRRRLLAGESMVTDGLTNSIGYGYDSNGHLTTQTYPVGGSVAYAPNALGQPTRVANYATGALYFPNGQLKQFAYGNGIVYSAAQNARGLMSRQTACAVTGSCVAADRRLDLAYAYDQQGNVSQITDYRNGRQTRGMSYDALDRLTQTTSNMFGTASYSYDVLDNLITVRTTGGSHARNHTYQYNSNNRLSEVRQTTNGAVVTTLSYDIRGNLTSKGSQGYQFDFGNRLRAATGVASYAYDGHGRRVRDTTTAPKFSMYKLNGELIHANDQRRGVRTNYFYLGGVLVAQNERNSAGSVVATRYLHTDVYGSPIAETNANKTLVESSEYEPYGQIVNRGIVDGPGFTGHVQDAATGLTYMQQRYYDPGIGRMLSVDPVTAYQNPITNFCRYCYARNNPYKFIDPDGRDGRLHWTASDQVTFTVPYVLTGVPSPVTAAQINAQVAQDFSGTTTINGTNVTVTGQAIQVQQAGPGVNTINVVQDTAGVTQSGRSETNKIGGNQITIGATGPNAATAATVSHELGGHGGGAGDQYKGGLGANNVTLPADIPGPANVMKDLSGQPANSQTLREIISARSNVNTCAQGVSAASGGC